MSEEQDFWEEYNWNWKSPDDVNEFVEVALEHDVYQYAWGA